MNNEYIKDLNGNLYQIVDVFSIRKKTYFTLYSFRNNNKFDVRLEDLASCKQVSVEDATRMILEA